ncbi:MAG: ferritin-like domain-containing protein [Deltaproteobacteria bacterium]|nr:ferritin-like domain-containing protein [Deltaproteobacteria bacterium]MBW2414847.1 ferritin-like domain-containing protein [Deltaproteobacteria bacterium]
MSYYGSTEYMHNSDFILAMKDIRKGNLDLGWLDKGAEQIEVNADNPKRGLTYLDLNKGSYGYDELPEVPRGPRSAAPRGAAYDVDHQADMSPELNRKSDVWAYKVASFYEEAMSRQWDASTDVPWADLDHCERSEEVEIAFAQLCTFFTEVEMIATDLPAKWAWRMNNQFHEVKGFIATQAIDEARHAEVFRKRALAGGVGLMEAMPQAEHSLKAILETDTYSEASAFMHLLAEGNILTMFRFSEFISPTPVDKRMFQLVMQDEARHVSYGLQHLKWVLDKTPERKPQLHAALDEAENFSISQFDSALFEAMIVLAGKGTKPDQIKRGIEIVGTLQIKQIEEYFQRLRRSGFEERIAVSKFRDLLAMMTLSGKDAELPV